MPSELVLNALRSMEFTQDLEPKQLEKLASIATYVTFSEGATIFREGDGSELVYLIMEGDVSLLTQVPGLGKSWAGHPYFHRKKRLPEHKLTPPRKALRSTPCNFKSFARPIMILGSRLCHELPRSFLIV